MERRILWVILSAAAWKLSQETCPLDCRCPSNSLTNCSELGLQNVPGDIDEAVEVLDVSYNGIKIVNTPNLLYLKYLNLSHNFISQASFSYLPQLIHLDLSYNHFSNVHQLSVAELPALKTLSLAGNRRITELKTIKSDSLETLDLSHSGVSSFSNSALSKLSNIQALFLKNTSITSLQKLRSESLEFLDVANNEISEINFFTLTFLPNLQTLIAAHNEKLHVELSGPCMGLQKVDFSSCSLPRIKIGSLCQVEEVRFDRNSVEIIDDNTFLTNSILKTLNVAYNNLETISKWAFLNATQLKTVDVSNNQLQKIDWTKYLMEVRILNISYNKLFSIDGINLPSVINLDLSQNKISIFQISLRKSLPQIESLNLRYNFIEYLQPMESDTLKSLKLGYCQISMLDRSTFQKLTKLNFLDLEGNKLKRLNYLTLSLVPKLIDVQLGHNPWSCDCKSMQFRNLTNYLVMKKTLVSDMNSLRCDEVKKSWLETCPPQSSTDVSEKHILFIVAAFFILALLGMGLLVYCKARHIRRMATETLHRTNVDEDGDRYPVGATNGLPFRRSHSEAEVYSRSPPTQQSLPPPSYEEALLMPPLSETERMTRSMGVLLDRTA